MARRAPLLPLAVAGCFALTAPAAAADPTLHARGTPTVDGVESAEEWAGAATVDFELDGGPVLPLQTLTFALLSDDDNLYLAVRADGPFDGSGESFLYLRLDAVDAAAAPCALTTLHDVHDVVLPFGSGTPGHADLFQTLDGECALNEGVDEDSEGTTDGAGTAGDEGSSWFFEAAMPLDTADDAHDLNVEPTRRLMVAISFAGCDGTDCGVPPQFAVLGRRVYLEAEGLVFFDDFETAGLSLWSATEPPAPPDP